MRNRLLAQSPVGPEPAGHESSGAAASRHVRKRTAHRDERSLSHNAVCERYACRSADWARGDATTKHQSARDRGDPQFLTAQTS